MAIFSEKTEEIYRFMKKYSSEFSVEGWRRCLRYRGAVITTGTAGPRANVPGTATVLTLRYNLLLWLAKGHYGRDRVLLELGLRGRKASRKRVGASMQRQGLRFKPKRRFRVTTNSKHGFPVAENLLNRNFTVSAPNQVLVSDITYLPSRCGWLYLDSFYRPFFQDGRGWCVSTSLSHEGVLEALYRAIWRRRPPAGLMIHSDRRRTVLL